jgi:hypothetical protein
VLVRGVVFNYCGEEKLIVTLLSVVEKKGKMRRSKSETKEVKDVPTY